MLPSVPIAATSGPGSPCAVCAAYCADDPAGYKVLCWVFAEVLSGGMTDRCTSGGRGRCPGGINSLILQGIGLEKPRMSWN